MASSSSSTVKLQGYDLYRALGSPKHVLAPMVDGSELAWRILSRAPVPPPSTQNQDGDGVKAGPQVAAQLCYSPMIHSKLFANVERDNLASRKFFDLVAGQSVHLGGLSESDRVYAHRGGRNGGGLRSVGSQRQTPGRPGQSGTSCLCRGVTDLSRQFCANDPEHLLAAAKRIEHRCDAVDINLCACPSSSSDAILQTDLSTSGCPQGIAKTGRYGAFLMEDWDSTLR